MAPAECPCLFRRLIFPSVAFSTSPLLTLTHLAGVISQHLLCSFCCRPPQPPHPFPSLPVSRHLSVLLPPLSLSIHAEGRIVCQAAGAGLTPQFSAEAAWSCLLCNLSGLVFERKPTSLCC